MFKIDLSLPSLSSEQINQLTTLRKRCAADILTAVHLAACGHPGGSLSSLDILLMLYATANVCPSYFQANQIKNNKRDKIIISHGHITPAVYAVLCAFGWDEREKFLAHFRQTGSRFGGHVETHVPGVEWNTGNLGQGLSAATACALGARFANTDAHTFVLMGDGEQQKGQIAEARRFAVKYKLHRLCAIVDANGLQIGGKLTDVMPTPIAEEYRTAGFNVLELDGHDYAQIFQALRQYVRGELPYPESPTVLILRTVMGKGISFMENKHHFHGTAPSREQLEQAFAELGVENEVDKYAAQRKAIRGGDAAPPIHFKTEPISIPLGPAFTYREKTDNRSAYGQVLKELAQYNQERKPHEKPVVCVSCDLEGSVKMTDFRKISPTFFIESGISEHHAAVLAGRLSLENTVTFFSTFGAFAGSETYNQSRLSDYNHADVKIVATHCGLDVGEDGPTHQSIDYVSLFSNLYRFEIFVPADPNQTDRIIRYIVNSNRPAFVAMGRSKLPILSKEDGTPFFSGDTPFVPGSYDCLRAGKDGAILVMGTLANEAILAQERIWQKLQKRFAVYVVASLRPFSETLVQEAAKTGKIITLEDHHVDTGLGRIVATCLADQGASVQLKRLGVREYATSGVPQELFAQNGLDAEGVLKVAESWFLS